MRIQLSEDALLRHYRKHEENFGPVAGWTSQQRSYRDKLRPFQGEWLVVDTEYVFSDQFNIREPSVRLMARLCDGLDLNHEEEGSKSFLSVEALENHVRAHYARSWPGSPPNTNPIRALANRTEILPDYAMLTEDQHREASPLHPDEKMFGVYEVGPDYRAYLIAGPYDSRESAEEKKEAIPPEHPVHDRSVREYMLSDEWHPDFEGNKPSDSPNQTAVFQ